MWKGVPFEKLILLTAWLLQKMIQAQFYHSFKNLLKPFSSFLENVA